MLFFYIINLYYKRIQRKETDASFSKWQIILKGLTQGSLRGPLLFSVFVNNLCILVDKTNLCNYAVAIASMFQDYVLYIIHHLIESFSIRSEWSFENLMIVIPGKSHFPAVDIMMKTLYQIFLV